MKTETWITIGAICNMLGALFLLLLKIDFSRIWTTIDLLEKNTNSIKDALVKTTGEAERAKGVLEGKADAKAAENQRY